MMVSFVLPLALILFILSISCAVGGIRTREPVYFFLAILFLAVLLAGYFFLLWGIGRM